MATQAELARVKRYLPVRDKDTSKDTLLKELIDSAKAAIDTFLEQLARENATAETSNQYPTIRSLRSGGIDTSGGTLTVWTMASLVTQPDYVTRILPLLNQAVNDVVAHWFRHRSPNSRSESEGGGISDTWADLGKSGLPQRVEDRLRSLARTLDAA